MSSNLQNNLTLLYKNYGGLRTIFCSSYFWISGVCTFASWRWIVEEQWIEKAQSILPALAGFSIASFAILIALFDPKDRRALKAPSEQLGGKSPLLSLVSSICHAIIIQIAALILSAVIESKSIPTPCVFSGASHVVNIVSSGVGLFLFYYGILLVMAMVLKIFRTVDLAS